MASSPDGQPSAGAPHGLRRGIKPQAGPFRSCQNPNLPIQWLRRLWPPYGITGRAPMLIGLLAEPLLERLPAGNSKRVMMDYISVILDEKM
jgi:hypothetical protein